MEINIIKDLINSFNEAKLSGLQLKCDEFELKLEKEEKVYEAREVIKGTPYTGTQSNNSKGIVVEAEKEVQVEDKESNTKTILSPIVGTFYLASSPKSEPFVKVGRRIKKGDIVCVIEAMKLMNEVESEIDGEIVEVLAMNEDMVEYGQPLFVVK